MERTVQGFGTYVCCHGRPHFKEAGVARKAHLRPGLAEVPHHVPGGAPAEGVEEQTVQWNGPVPQPEPPLEPPVFGGLQIDPGHSEFAGGFVFEDLRKKIEKT